jgi:mono/diheme cytochrome c family protein
MAVGTMHNRWYYTLGGQVLNQGVSAAMGTVRYSSQCGACHGEPNGVGGRPLEQEAPDAVTGASLSLSRYTEQNPRRPIDPVVAGPATRVEVDFRRDVQPILERRCVSCHGASSPAGGLSLTSSPTAHFTTAYEQLLAPGTGSGNARAYVDDGDGRARTSYLVELVTGRELDAPRALTTQGTPHPSTGQGSGPLTDEERLVLIRWIELGATFQGLGHGGTP